MGSGVQPLSSELRVHADKAARERISQVLHDEVGQVVSAVGLKLELLRMDFEKRTPELAERVVGIQQLLETAMAPLRSLISGLAMDLRAETGGQTREEETRQ